MRTTSVDTVRSKGNGVALPSILPGAQFLGGRPAAIHACCDDSRLCKPGDLFAAIMGQETDGHAFANEAIANGAVAVLAERPLPLGVPTCIVKDTRQAFGMICHALAGNPSDAMRVVGVSGTYGKTATSVIVASILEAAGESIGIHGSLGSCDGRQLLADSSIETTSPAIARWLANSADNGCTHAILEASSSALAARRLTGTKLDAAVITNVRRAHLDLHGSVINYRRIKQRLFEHLKPGGFVVLNADDPASQHVLKSVNHPTITIGMRADAEITAQPLSSFHGEQTFMLTAGEESIAVQTSVIGRSHVYNCLSAAAVALVLGIQLPDIVRGIEAVESIPGRMERVDPSNTFATYVDAASTADSLAGSLNSLRRLTKGRLLCVYGAAAEGDVTERPLMGRAVERCADIGVITRNNPLNEDPARIAHDVLDGYDRPAQAHLIPDRAKAIGWALAEAEPGDTVLIAGRGDARQEIIDGQRLDFDDRAVVRAFLQTMDRSPQQTIAFR